MTEALRALVTERARGRCEYCKAPSYIGTHRFSIEHITPHALGGVDDALNLALSCQGCNNRKYIKLDAEDPLTQTRVPLFHPRKDQWDVHFEWSEDYAEICGKTPAGRATIHALQLNRDEVVRFRRVLVLVGEHPPSEET